MSPGELSKLLEDPSFPSVFVFLRRWKVVCDDRFSDNGLSSAVTEHCVVGDSIHPWRPWGPFAVLCRADLFEQTGEPTG